MASFFERATHGLIRGKVEVHPEYKNAFFFATFQEFKKQVVLICTDVITVETEPMVLHGSRIQKGPDGYKNKSLINVMEFKSPRTGAKIVYCESYKDGQGKPIIVDKMSSDEYDAFNDSCTLTALNRISALQLAKQDLEAVYYDTNGKLYDQDQIEALRKDLQAKGTQAR